MRFIFLSACVKKMLAGFISVFLFLEVLLFLKKNVSSYSKSKSHDFDFYLVI